MSSPLNELILLSLKKEELEEIIRKVVRDELQLHAQNGKGVVAKSEDQPMTTEECATFLHLSKSTIYNLTAKREIPFLKRGKCNYFLKSEVLGYLKEGRKATVSEIKVEADISMLKK